MNTYIERQRNIFNSRIVYNRWNLDENICRIMAIILALSSSTASTTHRKKWRKSSQSLSQIWRQFLINRRCKRLQRWQMNRMMLISRDRMIILWLNSRRRRRSIIVLERIVKLNRSNLRSRNSRQMKWLDRRRKSRYLKCSSLFGAIERVCVSFVSSCARSGGIYLPNVLIHSKQTNSHN